MPLDYTPGIPRHLGRQGSKRDMAALKPRWELGEGGASGGLERPGTERWQLHRGSRWRANILAGSVAVGCAAAAAAAAAGIVGGLVEVVDLLGTEVGVQRDGQRGSRRLKFQVLAGYRR